MEACSQYVGAVMGKAYVEPLTWTLDGIFPTTTSRTPILFVLSAGADPTYQLQRFGESMGRDGTVKPMSICCTLPAACCHATAASAATLSMLFCRMHVQVPYEHACLGRRV